MNLFNKSKGGGVGFNRHPQSSSNGTYSETPVEVENCWGKIKRMFIPVKPILDKIVFSELAWAKIHCYINLIGNLEITGFGKIEDGIVTDIKIIRQSVKSTLVDSTSEQLIS